MSAALAVLNTTTATNTLSTGEYWPYPVTTTGVYWPPVWPTTYYYHTDISQDRGEKAFKLAQALVEKKLVEARTAKQFIGLMNAILEHR